MEIPRTMSYFGVQNGSRHSSALPIPNGPDRRSRLLQSMPQSPSFDEFTIRALLENHAGLKPDDRKIGKILQAVREALDPRNIGTEFGKLPTDPSKPRITPDRERAQVLNGTDTGFTSRFWKQRTVQERDRHTSIHSSHQDNRETIFGKEIRLPLFWGESAFLYVSSETCWIPLKLLEKIFDCPKHLLGAFCPCSKRSSPTTPSDSICYNCLRALRSHFHRFLFQETRPILDNLQSILEKQFINRNGFAMRTYPFHWCISDQDVASSNSSKERRLTHRALKCASCRTVNREVPRFMGDDKRVRRLAA